MNLPHIDADVDDDDDNLSTSTGGALNVNGRGSQRNSVDSTNAAATVPAAAQINPRINIIPPSVSESRASGVPPGDGGLGGNSGLSSPFLGNNDSLGTTDLPASPGHLYAGMYGGGVGGAEAGDAASDDEEEDANLQRMMQQYGERQREDEAIDEILKASNQVTGPQV